MSEFTSGTLTATGTTPSGINNSASQLVINTVGFGSAVFTIGQGSTGTVSFFASGDGGVNWSPLLVMPSYTTTPVTTASAPGLWQANPGAYTHVSMVATAVSGGGLNTSIHISTVAAFDGGGGGGPGGMNPPGSTGIGTFSTTGTSGAASYNATTGALNIPNYTVGVTAQVYASQALTFNTTMGSMATNSTRLIGFYIPFTIVTGNFCYSCAVADNTANTYDIGLYNSLGNLVVDTGVLPGTTLFSSVLPKTRNWAQTVTITPGVYALAMTSGATTPAAALGGSTPGNNNSYGPFSSQTLPGTTSGSVLAPTIVFPTISWGLNHQATIVLLP